MTNAEKLLLKDPEFKEDVINVLSLFRNKGRHSVMSVQMPCSTLSARQAKLTPLSQERRKIERRRYCKIPCSAFVG